MVTDHSDTLQQKLDWVLVMILRKQENDKRRQQSLRSPSGLPPPGFISSRSRFDENSSERLLNERNGFCHLLMYRFQTDCKQNRKRYMQMLVLILQTVIFAYVHGFLKRISTRVQSRFSNFSMMQS